MIRENMVQDFRMATTEERLPVMADWLELVLLDFIKRDGNNNLGFLSQTDKEARQFTNRAVMAQENPSVDWYLPQEWFRSIFAQSLQNGFNTEVKAFYKKLGWNYKRSINPKSGDGCTLQAFDFSAVIQEASNMTLRLVSRDAFPVDTILVSSANKHWAVLGYDGCKYELEGENGNIIFRTRVDIYRNFKVV